MSQETIKFSQFLQKTFPPQLIIDVGIGMGAGPMHQWHKWDVMRAWLIEADATKLEWATPLLAEKPHWQTCICAIAQKNGQAEFYSASNPAESALYAPEKLKALWPGLNTLNHEVRETQCLDSMIRLPDPAISHGWLIIDCLPALGILQGASATLNHCSVVWLRVLLQPVAGMDAGSGLTEITSYLQSFGFDCVNVGESNHPALGDAIFIRQWLNWLRPQINALTRANAELTAEQTSKTEQQQLLITELTELADIRARQTRQIEQQNSQIAALQEEKSKLNANITTLEQAKTRFEQSLQQAHVQASAQTNEYMAKLDEQSKEIARQQAMLQEKNQAISAVNEAYAAIGAERDTLVQQHSELSKELGQSKTSQEQQLAGMEQKRKAINTLQEEKANLVANLDLLLPELTTLKQNQDRLSDEVKQLESVRAQQVELIHQHRQQIAALESEMTEVMRRHAALEQEAKAMRLEKERLDAQLPPLIAQKDRFKQENDALANAQHLLQQEKIALEQQKNGLVHQVDALTIALRDKTMLTEQQQDSIQTIERQHAGQIETLNQALVRHVSMLEEKKDAFNKLEQEISALIIRQAEYQAEIATLRAGHLEQSEINRAQAQQIEQLNQVREELDAIVLKQELGLKDKERDLSKMEIDLEQTRQRQRQISEEMVRAEAQIDLIKNVFLRDVNL